MANRYAKVKLDRKAMDLAAYGPVYTCTQCGLSYHSFEDRTVCVECVEKNEAAAVVEPEQEEDDEPLVYDRHVGYITRTDAGHSGSSEHDEIDECLAACQAREQEGLPG